MNNISFRKLKTIIKTKGLSIAEVAERCGELPTNISSICNDRRTPLTDFVAKICSVLKVYPSEIVSFDGITVNEEYFMNDKREPLPQDFTGMVTYKPMWLFLVDYLAEYNREHPEAEKTENELFDQIEPPRRVNGCKGNNLSAEQIQSMVKKAVATRFGEGYVAKRQNRKPIERKGLPPITRTKLRNDRPLNLSVIYEICKKLGCTIDFVMSYK